MTITFKTQANFDAFMVMAEGMWLNYRDDSQEPEFSLADRLMDEMNAAWKVAGNDYPMTLPLSTTVQEMAESVLENCLDYTRDDYVADEDEPVIIEGEVTIQ